MEPRQYEYEGTAIHVILTDPRVRRALVEGFNKYPDDMPGSAKIERIKYLRSAVLLYLKDAKDVVEHVMLNPYLLKEWEGEMKVRKFVVCQYEGEYLNFEKATLVTSIEQLNVLKEFYSKLPEDIRVTHKLRIFTEEGV